MSGNISLNNVFKSVSSCICVDHSLFFLHPLVHCGKLDVPTDSFGGSVKETQSSAPGGPGGDLLGGTTVFGYTILI